MTSFFEAFPGLSVDDKTYDIFSNVGVKKISASKAGKLVKIDLNSNDIIPYRIIKNIEKKLYKQVFSTLGFKPLVEVLYPSLKNLDLNILLNKYEETLMQELRERSAIEYAKFCKNPFDIKDNKLTIFCDDDFLCHQKSEDIRDFFVSTIKKRFDKDIEIDFKYQEKKKKEKVEPEVYLEKIKISEEEKEKEAESNISSITQRKSTKKDNKKYFKKKAASKDPSCFYGKNVEGDIIPIKDLIDGMGDIVVNGYIRKVDERELKNKEMSIISISITDFTDTIVAKVFAKKEQIEEESLFEFLKKGNFIRLKGEIAFDSYDKALRIGRIKGIKEIESFIVERNDTAPVKRVELHAHTQMSDSDAVTDTKKLVNRAQEWGHPAVAITDHGVVQSFSDAEHAISNKDFKVIYGCEAYLVDDLEETIIKPMGQSLRGRFVVYDLETTGFSPSRCKIIEIGAVKIEEGKIVDRFSTFVDPQIPIPVRITELTQITDAMVKGAPLIEEILPKFLEFCKDSVLVAHNANFDYSFIKEKGKEQGIDVDFSVVDTVGIGRVLFPDLGNHKLDSLAKVLKVSLINHHRAVEDAEATAAIFEKMIPILEEMDIKDLDSLYERTHCAPEIIKKKPYYHTIILAKNEVGRLNLYRLVSMSHLDYFFRRPRIPKSKLMEYREGLIIGSACEAGQLYRALLDEASDERIKELVEFYDYLEIQPIANNEFMFEKNKNSSKNNIYENINSWDDLKEMNRRIVKLGEKYNKPVCATCDVHFLDPDDDIYRTVLLAGKGIIEKQPPLYFRTTDEMLDEFKYLGEEKAYEVVVKNTNMIADMIEKFSPVFPDKCPPVIENSDVTLRQICYDKAKSMYGEDIPEPVSNRLEKELNSIIKNGFAVMYIIAQKLVWKSNEDGYLVGSRGSVGSSFVATMSGITEVNPLPAHYYCQECHYSDFDSEEVKKYAGSSGFDMPPKNCPVCGKPLVRDGHDIPFETFLGFYGDKEPDIDLNFSGDYQGYAHAYTEVIFGKGQTFRAGTVGTLAEKTAYGYALKYCEDSERKKVYDKEISLGKTEKEAKEIAKEADVIINKRSEELERMSEGCIGVKRTTGQHPGGIVVLPKGWDINTFTPVQHPANDMNTPIITTHFDYHKIDHNLLKLDILGHDDPTIIRFLEDLTGIDAKTIPLDDKGVLDLFAGVSSLGLEKGELFGSDLGSLGVPEFGTEFVMQMLRDTKPKNFSDLVRISGLSHGTDVWLNNAQYFIANGDCTLSTAICTRDDIMTYLIYKGVENGLAFKIMESVRKGKGLTEDMEKAMVEAGVEDWYIESCKRIKYMFPKAHAVAYVMMAFRIAYFKVYYPLAYYAAYFGIRAKSFDYELMCQGKERLENNYKDYKSRKDSLSNKEKDEFEDMKLVQEMYARGYEFIPIDIFKAKAKQFQIIDDKLMPALNTIEGLGENAALAIEEAVKDGPFSSCENFKSRCKVSGTVVDKMRSLGLLEGLPLSDQMSLFDFMN